MKSDETITHIGAYDAKTRFSALLDRVERGEEIVITRHNMPVARLIPEGPARNARAARAAVANLTKIRQALTGQPGRLSAADIRALREETRR